MSDRSRLLRLAELHFQGHSLALPQHDDRDLVGRFEFSQREIEVIQTADLLLAEFHNHVAALISQWGGHDVLNMLELNYTTYRLFVASALGAEPNYRTNTVNGRGVLPHRVTEPLLWLMARRNFIRTDA